MLLRMASKRRPITSPPDLQEGLRLHLEASQAVERLLAEALALSRAGKVREARKREKAAREIQAQLRALEECYRPPRVRG